MNCCISAELPIKTVDFSLNGITMSTDEYSLGHFSLLGSGEYDDESGFYYLRSRYYDPSIGRFLNGDLLIQGDIKESNLFIYEKDNPLKYGDIEGYDAVVLWYPDRAHGQGHISLLIQDEMVIGITSFGAHYLPLIGLTSF